MTWTGAIAAIDADLRLAAADVTPAVPIVKYGEPDALNADTIWYAPTGRRDSATGGNTFGKVNIERAVQVTALLRGSVRAGVMDQTLEERLIALDAALLTRLWSDLFLGGHAIGIELGDASYDWAEVAGQLARSLTFTLWVDLSEVADITA